MAENVPTQDEQNEQSRAVVIKSYITEHPGLHFNDLIRVLNLAAGTLQYHLNKMERANEIIVIRDEYKTLYFPTNIPNPRDQKILLFLRQKIPRKLLLILMEDPNKSGQELITLLNKSINHLVCKTLFMISQ